MAGLLQGRDKVCFSSPRRLSASRDLTCSAEADAVHTNKADRTPDCFKMMYGERWAAVEQSMLGRCGNLGGVVREELSLPVR